MHRSRIKYVVEIIIHALFWLGVFYVLRALMASSHSMVIEHGNKALQRMDVILSFPYAGVVLGSLILLFYSNTFWLFKQVIRYKNALPRVAVITGWFVLLFAANYLLVRMLIGSSSNSHNPQNAALLQTRSDSILAVSQRTRIFFESRSDTALFEPSPNLASHGPRTDTSLLLTPPNGASLGLPLPFGKSPADNWSHMQLVIALVFLSVLAIAAANFFIKEWIRNDLTRSQVQAQQLRTELRLLRSQVNPHFLFNTLNNLFSMAQKKGHEELADSISKLSGMMRYMIYESNTDTVPLQREITYLEDCIVLNKLRYADNEVAVSFHHPSPAVASTVSIAPMLFVPFLENAFKHGVAIGHLAIIAIDISVVGKKLIFVCVNSDFSGVKKLEEEKGGIGLENVRRRLQLLYPGRHELQAGAEGGKYTVNLQIELA
jgi:two-component system, LytTR family, sensor kinase